MFFVSMETVHNSTECGQYAIDTDGTLYRVSKTPVDPNACTTLYVYRKYQIVWVKTVSILSLTAKYLIETKLFWRCIILLSKHLVLFVLSYKHLFLPFYNRDFSFAGNIVTIDPATFDDLTSLTALYVHDINVLLSILICNSPHYVS